MLVNQSYIICRSPFKMLSYIIIQYMHSSLMVYYLLTISYENIVDKKE